MSNHPDIYVCKESFVTEVDGAPVAFRRGVTRVHADHPILKGREHLFELVDANYGVESATAAPGEKRVRA